MKPRKRWIWLAAIIVPVIAFGSVLGWHASHLHPVTERMLEVNDAIICNADGFPVLEDDMDPSFQAPLDSYHWNRPLKTARLDAYCRPVGEVQGSEIRAISPSGEVIGWLERSWRRGDGSGGGGIMLQDARGENSLVPADYLPGNLYRSEGFTKVRSYPRLQILDNRYTIVLGDRSTLRDPQGKTLLKFEGNDEKTQFASFTCSDPRYIPIVHGVNQWTPVGTPRYNKLATYALYDTQTRREIALPPYAAPWIVLVRDEYFIFIQQTGKALVVERATGKQRRLGSSGSTWHVTNNGETCWTDGLWRKKHFAVLHWKTGAPKLEYTRIPVVVDPAAHYNTTFRRDGELAATAGSRPTTNDVNALAGRRTLTLYRHGRRAGTFAVRYHGQSTLDYTAERLAFSPDGRTLAWLLDTGDGNRSLYAFKVE
ncbi:MAG: hypothetical protein ACYC6A_20430 [Armatimonadota bacterium]